MKTIGVEILLILGAVLVAIAALGIVRMPDLFLRMSTTTKGSVIGLVVCLVGSALHFGDLAVWAKVASTVLFMVLTLPLAAHMIGRAGYFDRTPLWEGTTLDELSGKYDPESHELSSALSSSRPKSAEKAEPSPEGTVI
jgi:multicomponent Na+:H+ antiporter subunit G